MSSSVSRRHFLGIAAGTAALLTACAQDKPGAVADDGSVTVTHAFGETRIPAPPTKVVSAGLTDADDLLALGVVPIAVTDWFGAEPFGVWPWAQPKLGGAQPLVLSLADGIQIDQITALAPDLIVATDAGLDEETYNRLTTIAPTIAQTGRAAFFEPWRDQASSIGQAVFRHDDMQKLVADIDAEFTAVKDANPQFTGKKALLLAGTLFEDSVQVTGPAWRHEFLTQMGLTVIETEDLIPRDRIADVLDEADVLIWTTENDAEQSALLADPTIAALRAPQRHVFTGKELTGAIAYASTLSYPVVADRLPPMLAAALN
ncbi:ABC transporter substrate-binding protein [Mycolicibacterium iranicum]|uniref:Iron ABC transporter substrate-binding protein n=1 Tax=Mycolicibacterium iranicum TaxID=912594 RepID=A0A178LNZ6_MYCIR|nr:ABC transporter substrate-binding protein [Mycolicibacterium iranicum]OAN33781.1 iron ABC transporter substrate-binding protein [Mycolicibacterium iranicum]